MKMYTAKWTDEIDELTELFTQEFGNLTGEELNWTSHPKSWSVGQVVEHIITLNRTYFPLFTDIAEGVYRPPFMAKLGFVVRALGNSIYKSVLPETQRKTRTFPLWEPSKSNVPENILAEFGAHQEELKSHIQKLGNALNEGLVISSPASRNVVYTLEKALDIIVVHERRHLQQARRMDMSRRSQERI